MNGLSYFDSHHHWTLGKLLEIFRPFNHNLWQLMKLVIRAVFVFNSYQTTIMVNVSTAHTLSTIYIAIEWEKCLFNAITQRAAYFSFHLNLISTFLIASELCGCFFDSDFFFFRRLCFVVFVNYFFSCMTCLLVVQLSSSSSSSFGILEHVFSKAIVTATQQQERKK